MTALRVLPTRDPAAMVFRCLEFAVAAEADAERYTERADHYWLQVDGLPLEDMTRTYLKAKALGFERLAEAAREAASVGRERAESWAA